MKFLYSGTESLTSLQDIIETRYSAILMLEGSNVYGRDGVKDYFQEAKRGPSKPLHNETGATISMSINIKNVDQELCGNFFWDLAQKAIRDKFKFDFDIASSIRTSIAVDEFEAHHTIVRRAFEYLDKEPQAQTNEIGDYLIYWLPNHIEILFQLQADNSRSLMAVEQDEITMGLYNLFRNDTVLERHRKSFEKALWVAKEMKDIQNWLTASMVVWKSDEEWWKAMAQRAESPTKGYLKGFVNMVVKGLLRERSWDVANALNWIVEFMTAVSFPSLVFSHNSLLLVVP